MIPFNPLSGAVAGSVPAQRIAQAEREHHVRRAQALSKSVAAEDDRLEHQVESGDTVREVHGETTDADRRRKPQGHSRGTDDDGDGTEDDRPHIDVTA